MAFLARGGFPQADRPILACRDEELAIGTKGDEMDHITMP
jgi:hypothetical protein